MPNPFELWMEIAYHPIYKYNEIICCACYFSDITDRKITVDEISNIKKQLTFQQVNLLNLIQEEQNNKTKEINNGIKDQLLSITIDIAKIQGNGHSKRHY
mgnify:FL=1